jgi:hypothetical protein
MCRPFMTFKSNEVIKIITNNVLKTIFFCNLYACVDAKSSWSQIIATNKAVFPTHFTNFYLNL